MSNFRKKPKKWIHALENAWLHSGHFLRWLTYLKNAPAYFSSSHSTIQRSNTTVEQIKTTLRFEQPGIISKILQAKKPFCPSGCFFQFVKSIWLNIGYIFDAKFCCYLNGHHWYLWVSSKASEVRFDLIGYWVKSTKDLKIQYHLPKSWNAFWMK